MAANCLLCAAMFFGPVAFCAFLLACQRAGERVAAALEGGR